MKQEYITYALLFFVGFVVGGFATAFTGVEQTVPKPMEHSHEEEMHAHDLYEIPEGELIPEVDLLLHEDPKSGWNAEIQVSDFVFAPEVASTEHVPGQGHAHIYVNDEKQNRVYGSWYYLEDLHAGDVVSVRLSTNDHQEYAVNGQAISADAIVGGLE